MFLNRKFLKIKYNVIDKNLPELLILSQEILSANIIFIKAESVGLLGPKKDL